jgi:hypothetical protein
VPVFGNSDVALRHAALDFDGAARRIQDAAELDQKAVAHHLEDAPAMLGHGGIEELAAMLAERAKCAFLVRLHEPAVADDVGCKNRRQPSLDLFFSQSSSPQPHPVRCYSPWRVLANAVAVAADGHDRDKPPA